MVPTVKPKQVSTGSWVLHPGPPRTRWNTHGPPRETRLGLLLTPYGSRGGQNEKRLAGVWVLYGGDGGDRGNGQVPGVKNRGGAVYAKGAVHEQAGEETVVDPGAQGAAGEMGEERGYGGRRDVLGGVIGGASAKPW